MCVKYIMYFSVQAIFSSQDLGIQSTSTLHCVRGNFAANVEMQRSTRPIQVNLGTIQPTASAGKHDY